MSTARVYWSRMPQLLRRSYASFESSIHAWYQSALPTYSVPDSMQLLNASASSPMSGSNQRCELGHGDSPE